uniref:C-type lectin domain-containing protein n=1 Tax=Xiphophorus couchianus TaxID=32473 RepID=A0A3B5MLY9_9TELE
LFTRVSKTCGSMIDFVVISDNKVDHPTAAYHRSPTTEHGSSSYRGGCSSQPRPSRTHIRETPGLSYSDVKFTFINVDMNWTQAQSYCRNHYTDLARVRNMTDIQKIQTLIPAGQNVWIGFHRPFWMWVDGSRFSFSYWRSSEPSGSGEHCASADLGNSGQWENWDCDGQRPFICYNGKPPLSL